jgi:hypothetical protein
VAAAERYFERAKTHPEAVRQERERIIELLSAQESTGWEELQLRVAASGTLARLARDDSASLAEFLPVVADELRRETDSGGSHDASADLEPVRTVRANLVETISRTIIDNPKTDVGANTFTDFVEAVATDLEDRTLRVATRALFICADERAGELASVAELLHELLTYPDVAVQAWASGIVGRVAATHPDAVAGVAVDLRRCLSHEDNTVQHNALEALAAFVGTRPDVVAPAADTLRHLLEHDEVGIQHNAAGVLYVLAEHQPMAVIQAGEELRYLRDHKENAVRRIATATLARLAQSRQDPATGSKPENP